MTFPAYVDDRETHDIREIVKSKIPGFEEARLEVGDFMIIDQCKPEHHVLCIERKEMQDLLGSLVKNDQYPKGRLRHQLEEMNKHADSRLVIVEGTMWMTPDGLVRLKGNHDTKWRHAAAQAILYDEQRYWNVPFLFTADLEGTIDVVRFLYNRAAKGGCVLGTNRKKFVEGEDRQA